ncbi:MAG: hypothetical protein JXR96_02405 [Deltaproteobacteria bacterium]|nr:hypothetical protein [Deltaproteobacteria bacterium]
MRDRKKKTPRHQGKTRLVADKRLQKARNDFDAIEDVEVDVETDMTEVASRPLQASIPADLFAEDEPTMEVSALQPVTAEAKRKVKSSPTVLPPPPNFLEDEEVQPLFLPGSGTGELAFNEPVETLSTPDLSDFSQPDRPIHVPANVGALFDDLSEEKSVPTKNERRIPIPPPQPPPQAFPDPPGSQPIEFDAPAKERSKPKPRFATGFTAGMQPLDIRQFDTRKPTPEPKRVVRREPVRGLPMDHAQRIRRSRSIGIQEVLLIVLIVLLGVAIYIGWRIYQDYKTRTDALVLERGREKMEQIRDDAIQSRVPKKEKDIP